MRHTTPGCRSGLWLIALVGLVLLFTYFLSACSSGPTPAPFESPVETATPPPYPPPGDTPPPKPTNTPAPTPTITPVPTRLPVLSAYYALWVDTTERDSPGEPTSTIWRADPINIAGRRQIVHFDDRAIGQAIVSPDGRRLAFTTAPWKGQWDLWLVNVDGSGLRQLLAAAGLVLWSRDSRLLAHHIKEGTQGSVIETVNVATGARRQLVAEAPDVTVILLGWSANDQEVYYMRSSPQQAYELWAVGRTGQNAHSIASLGDKPISPILSPDGFKLLYSDGSPQGVLLFDFTQGTTTRVQPPGRWFVTWALDSTELLDFDISNDTLVLRSLNTITDQRQDIALIQNVPLWKWRPLVLSPDRNWLATYHYYSGLYWFYLPAGTKVHVPDQWRSIFVAWIPK